MNLKRLLPLALVGVVVLAGCNRQAADQSATPDSEPVENPLAQTADESFRGSITDLLQGGKSVQCSFTTSGDEGSSSGTVFVSGDQFKGEFMVEDQTAHMVRSGDYTYLWGDMYPQGIKMKDIDEIADAEVDSSQNDFDYDADYDYDCQPWSASAQAFDVPQDVSFMDMSTTMEQLQNFNQDFGDNACAACQQLTGDPKTQCEQALGCN